MSCTPNQEKVEKIMEDGAEVVINHLEPYKIKGEPSILHFEEEFTIDTEKDEIAELGVPDIGRFDIDSEGNIYFLQGRKNLVFKFDKDGHFVTSFGKRGQGPSEIAAAIYLNITEQDEIPIQDFSKLRLFIFNKNGTLIKEIDIGLQSRGNFFPLENGNYLHYRDFFDPSTEHRYDILELYSAKFQKLKELDRCDYGPLVMAKLEKTKGSPRVFISRVSDRMIYIGHENRGYEILVYDLNGNLLRKIRKEYVPEDITEEFRENLVANFGRYKDKLIIPAKMPPFHYFFLDDEGRLYVKTYEKGKNKDEYMHDVFNTDGIFIARKSMAGYGSWMYPGTFLNRAKAKKNRLYCIREKENGYKELVVYKMKWE
jgi:hypothetical protein